jgi:hypothetical protein
MIASQYIYPRLEVSSAFGKKLPLTMIALQYIYPQLEVSFGFGKKLRLARIFSFEVSEL